MSDYYYFIHKCMKTNGVINKVMFLIITCLLVLNYTGLNYILEKADEGGGRKTYEKQGCCQQKATRQAPKNLSSGQILQRVV